MIILGEIQKLRMRQRVGIYAPRLKEWIVASVVNINPEFVVVSDSKGTMFSFDYDGNCTSPSSARGVFHLIYCRTVSDRHRFSQDDRATEKYLADTYSEYVATLN